MLAYGNAICSKLEQSLYVSSSGRTLCAVDEMKPLVCNLTCLVFVTNQLIYVYVYTIAIGLCLKQIDNPLKNKHTSKWIINRKRKQN